VRAQHLQAKKTSVFCDFASRLGAGLDVQFPHPVSLRVIRQTLFFYLENPS
jgi:hypothetical protein